MTRYLRERARSYTGKSKFVYMRWSWFVTNVSECMERCGNWVRGVVVVRDCKICCEGGQQVGAVAMMLVLRAEVYMLGCLLLGGLKCFLGSD